VESAPRLTEEIEPILSRLTPGKVVINTEMKIKKPLACPCGERQLYDAAFWQNTCDVLSDPTVILQESEELNWQ